VVPSSPSRAAAEVPTLDVAAVYREHFDYVFTNLRRLGVPTSALEDACHDVFVVVHRRARTYDHRCAMRTWLYGVVRRVAADVRRSGTRHRRRVDALGSISPQPTATDDVVAERRLVQDFLDALDDAKREVFILVELEEMTAAEVAVALHINPNTAAARLRAARRAFAERIAATVAQEHELRIIALARASEPPPERVRARVWAGLAPIVMRGATSWLVAAGWAAGLVVVTATVAAAVESSPTPAAAIALEEHVEAAPVEAEPRPEPRLPPEMPSVAAMPMLVPEGAPPPVVTLAPATASPSGRDVPRAPSRADAPPTETRPMAPAPQVPTDAELRAETELAGRVLRATDPDSILALVDEYRRKFPQGFFADRLAARRIEALCRTDRQALARTEHETLARRQPALANKALARCSDDHELAAARPSSG
jgi:RNA polymerase sigma-70 factor (ECF subfamily)